MRDFVLLYVNGRQYQLRGSEVFWSLADFLRRKLRLTGTKVVCSEGDCGTCTVLCGKLVDGQVQYQTLLACIRFVYQLDGCHIVTVEGIESHGNLTAVQESMVRCHGSQCGFCTPGFVLAITGILEREPPISSTAWRDGLTGNLCRCTGYAPILEAAEELKQAAHERLGDLYPDRDMVQNIGAHTTDTIAISSPANGQPSRQLFSPTTIDECVRLYAQYPTATLVAGGTDLGVQINKGSFTPEILIDLNRISALTDVFGTEKQLILGSRATWTQVLQLCQTRLPEFAKILRVFGSPHIRHVGTVGGNIFNASPIADSLPFFLIAEASLELLGPDGPRTVPLNDFYTGYKKFNQKPGELLISVKVPIPQPNQTIGLYRVARRRDLDIATFTAGIMLQREGDEIRQARVAFGAVGPNVLRARQTEQYLTGKPFTTDTMRGAGNVAIQEISPISDVRGSAQYRQLLTKNTFLKFYYEQIH
ncbi:MAG: FAD binding domain-containing protein [Pirellulaceae bacterium]|nr:FAD binding domain-containing protein [Pirellulaceae bacterium]